MGRHSGFTGKLHRNYRGIMRELWGDTEDLQGNYIEITGELDSYDEVQGGFTGN